MRSVLLLLVAVAAFGQNVPANFTNAKLETRQFSGNLEAEIRSEAPAWFAYAVTSVNKDNESCCWDGTRGCRMEEVGGTRTFQGKPAVPIALEGSAQAMVLLRAETKSVNKVRFFSVSCPLDAGGLPVFWINGVTAAASVAYLEKLALTAPEKVADGAVFALAQHAAPEADSALDKLTQTNQPEHLREKAVFWLGSSRGAKGVTVLSRIVREDPNEHVREKAIFALSISSQPEALTFMIETAKHDASSHVRGQALFWLAQKAGKRSSQAITDAIENDPDTGVKKQAVFALSQLPKEDGIPKLIQIASTQRNAEVRKQAFFWLGQSHDPRALAFIEGVLVK